MLPVYDVNHISIIPNVEIEFVINYQLFLETLLMEIRGKTISYSAFKNKEKHEMEKNTHLEDEIKLLEENINNMNLEQLETKKHELEELRKEKLKGHYVRSKAKWIEEGGKPRKYSCNMESRNYHSKLITKIELADGEQITDQSQMLQETNNFYKKHYIQHHPH